MPTCRGRTLQGCQRQENNPKINLTVGRHAVDRRWPRRGNVMTTKLIAGAFTSALLVATALTPVGAADMTQERALNPQREPQNWILHHGNYQGHRFSLLTDISADTVKNLKPMFTVALGGFQSG